MIKIGLGGSPGTTPYGTGNKSISKEIYSGSNLFFRHTHNRTGDLSSENISVYEKNLWGNYLTLKADDVYSGYYLTHQHVYFNKYNENTPLILVLFFRASRATTGVITNRIHRLANIASEISLNDSKNISELEGYTSDENLLSVLFEENDKHNVLTYDIGQTTDNSHGHKYNGNKITVNKLTTAPRQEAHILGLPEKLIQNGFRMYRHDPDISNKGNNSCFIYKKQPLTETNANSFSNIQGKKYNVTVYFGSTNIPLLLEFNQGGQKDRHNENIFYYNNSSDDKFLKWEEIKKNTRVLEVEFTDDETIFKQFTDSNFQKLISILQKLSTKLITTIFFILDQQEGNYNKSNIEKIFINHNNYNIINNNSITVNNKSDSSVACLNVNNFNVYVHNFGNSIASLNDTDEVELKFLIANSSTQYNIITLYTNNSIESIGGLKYSKSTLENEQTLHAYFSHNDPRPILLCYDGNTYKPKDMDNYTTKWHKVSNVNSCVCQGTVGNSQLLKVLLDVVGFLNPVNLHKETEYPVQNFKGNDIKINVNRSELTCYNKYEHTPNGGDKLGNIGYDNNSKKGTLSYSNQEDNSILTSVICYYYKKDNNREYPLIVELKFKGSKKGSFYNLTVGRSSCSWTSLSSNLVEDQNKLLEQLFKLNQRFNSSNTYPPNKSGCIPRDNTPEIAGGVTTAVLGAGGVAGGVLYFKYPQLIASLISKLAGK